MRRGMLLGAVLLGTSLLMVAATQVMADPTMAGSEACKDCHQKEYAQNLTTSHGRAQSDGAALPEKMSCETCHGAGSAHVAAGGDTKDPGFATIQRPDKQTAAKANAICLSCHKGGDQFYWQHSAHARKELACVGCHSIHNSKDGAHAKLLKAENTTALCITCHKSSRLSMAKTAHMPVGSNSMSCSDCHNPHGSAGPKQVRALTTAELCLSCHADKRGPFLWEHAPVRENCLTCHDAHGSNNPRMLASRQPFLCNRCHDASRHPSQLRDNYDRVIGEVRLTNRSCVNCHSQIHGSNHPSGKTFLR
jgi:DmsE family decaheme c-type cytochrome